MNDEISNVRTYVVRLTCAGETLDKLLAGAMKEGAVGVLAAAPQSEAEGRRIRAWFERNV